MNEIVALLSSLADFAEKWPPAMTAGLVIVFYLFLKKDNAHIKELLGNHVTGTEDKIKELKTDLKEDIKELKADLKGGQDKLEKKIDSLSENR